MHDEWLVEGSEDAPLTVILAHSAGAAMDTPFMDYFAVGLAGTGLRVVRFEFPYMRRRRTEGKRSGPDRAEVLLETWRAVVAAQPFAPSRIVIGGKSMGGRIASMCADELGVAGLICLGYPFHPTGKPDRLRVAHLIPLKTPCLIVQGTRDTMGNATEVAALGLPDELEVAWLADGDHSFKPRKKSGVTLEDNLSTALNAARAFIDKRILKS